MSDKKKYTPNRNKKSRIGYYLERGQRGFLASCNFREKDCVRECYNLLNHYADILYGSEHPNGSNHPPIDDKQLPDHSDDDIESDLAKEIQSTTKKHLERFKQVDTGVPNIIFIKTTIPDPVELGTKIISDIAETKVQRTKFLLRLLPIETICQANIPDIVNAAGTLFDKYFLNTEPTTYAIVFGKRFNNKVDRDETIRALADLVTLKNPLHKVDLKKAETSIIVEVMKGLCCMSVVPKYFQYKKYNLLELCTESDDKEPKAIVVPIESKESDKKDGEGGGMFLKF